MKILMIVPYPIVPIDEGGRSRAYNLMRHLRKRHEVVLLTPPMTGNAALDLDVTVYEIAGAGRRRQILSPPFLARATRVIKQERPDCILSEYVWSGLHAMLLSQAFGIPYDLDAPNVEGLRFLRAGSWFWFFVEPYERLVARSARNVFAVSDEDRALFVTRGVREENVRVVPNGVNIAAIHPDVEARAALRRGLGIGEHARVLLFFGQLDYAANRQALTVLEEQILLRLDRRLGDYVLLVAGKGDQEELRRLYRHPRLRLLGPVDEISPYINAADTVLVPLLSGGGTRLKIIESIACGVPVVSTTIGAEGIDRSVCGDLLAIADTWDAFAAAVATPPDRRSAPPSGFIDTYSWTNIVNRLPF